MSPERPSDLRTREEADRGRGAGGIGGKFAAMYDERELLRGERDQLQAQVAQLLAEKQAAETIKKFGFGLDEQEQQVWDALLWIFEAIVQRWRLRSNHGEVTAAMHVLQGFVIQHMLGRLAPERFGNWWMEPEKETPDDSGV